MHRISTALGVFVVLAVPPAAGAATFTWPGAAPCNTTLAACVSAVVAGSVVEIATASPIDEDVQVLGKSLVVRAAPGYTPAFAPTRFLHATAGGATDVHVTFEGLTITDGNVTFSRSGTGDSTFVVRRMRLLNSDPATPARIRMAANTTGSFRFDVAENEVQTRTNLFANDSITVETYGPDAAGTIRFNRLTATGTGSIAGILGVAPEGALELDVFANEIRGNYPQGAIRVTNYNALDPAGDLDVRLVNNVIVGTGSAAGGTSNGAFVLAANGDLTAVAVNNTITSTRSALFFGRNFPTATGDITGTVRNNLVAFNDRGIDVATFEPGVTNSRNLVFGNAVNPFTPGTGTVTANPRLADVKHPRLHPTSPAINAGDATHVQALLAANGLPQVDADGMRRTIGNGVLGVDIGAYEWGDLSFVARKPVAGGNHFALDHLYLNGMPGLRPLLTKNFSAGGVTNPFVIGTYYFGGFWRAFNQGLDTMPLGTGLNVFVPGFGGPYGASYDHVATAGNTSGHLTTLDDPFLNGNCGAIVQATHNWNAASGGVYNNHHISVGCLFSWFVLNQDFEDVPLDAAFNVYGQDPSPNAYVHVVRPHNRDGPATVLDHRLLNGVPCAQVQVTQATGGTANDHPYDVFYASGFWQIYNQDGVVMPLDAAFYVLVNPRQVFECTDLIFEDGFQ
jgi:hypothetical protein